MESINSYWSIVLPKKIIGKFLILGKKIIDLCNISTYMGNVDNEVKLYLDKNIIIKENKLQILRGN